MKTSVLRRRSRLPPRAGSPPRTPPAPTLLTPVGRSSPAQRPRPPGWAPGPGKSPGLRTHWPLYPERQEFWVAASASGRSSSHEDSQGGSWGLWARAPSCGGVFGQGHAPKGSSPGCAARGCQGKGSAPFTQKGVTPGTERAGPARVGTPRPLPPGRAAGRGTARGPGSRGAAPAARVAPQGSGGGSPAEGRPRSRPGRRPCPPAHARAAPSPPGRGCGLSASGGRGPGRKRGEWEGSAASGARALDGVRWADLHRASGTPRPGRKPLPKALREAFLGFGCRDGFGGHFSDPALSRDPAFVRIRRPPLYSRRIPVHPTLLVGDRPSRGPTKG